MGSPDMKVCAALGVALVLGIAGTAAPKIATFSITHDGSTDTYSWGLWSIITSDPRTSISVQTKNTCWSAVSDPDECVDALASKCKASKAFAVLGVLSNGAALALCFFNKTLFGTLASAASSLSYLVVFAVSATYVTGSGSGSDCSFVTLYSSVDLAVDLGASFGLFVVAFIVTAAAAVMTAMKNSDYNPV